MNRCWLVLCLLMLAGCRRDMFVQPKANPLQASDFFTDGGASRPAVTNTIARGQLDLDQAFYEGRVGTNLVTAFPYPVTRAMLERGRDRFEIYCSPCHGLSGEGDGMVVRRGFPVPPSYHIDRLRQAPIGHFVDVINRGYGIMYPYGSRVDPADRWAIAAYIRALQLSRDARTNDVPASNRAQLETSPP